MEIVYRLLFYKDALKDINFWKKSGDKSAMRKIDKILEALEKNPHSLSPGDLKN